MSYSQIFLDACNTNILMLLVKQKWHPTYVFHCWRTSMLYYLYLSLSVSHRQHQ